MEPQRHNQPFDVILHVHRQGVKRLPKPSPIGVQFLHADPHITVGWALNESPRNLKLSNDSGAIFMNGHFIMRVGG